MKKLLLRRIRDNGVQTMGRLIVFDDDDASFRVDCVTLEPSWILNETYVSCIPTGMYMLKKRTSEKFGKHLHVIDVPGRTYILIHALNKYIHTQGCIGPGERFTHMDSDDHLDVVNSRATLDKLLGLLPDVSSIEIVEHKDFQRFYSVASDHAVNNLT